MGNSLALLGLLAIAVPVIIHMLARHHSRIERFPTLRFISLSRLNPTSRRRISDLLLLLVRSAIVAVAAVALTQPSCSTRASDASKVVTRVVIVDTSASMSRLTPSGPVASVIARQIADRESAGVLASRVETESPATAIQGAVAWLAARPGSREIVVVSDFQRSALDSVDLAAIPADIGLTLQPVIPSDARIYPERSRGTRDISTFVDPSEANAADASWRAIGLTRPTDTTGRIVVLTAAKDLLFKGAAPIDSAWMARIVTTLQRDATLGEAAMDAKGGGAGPDTVVVNRRGDPVILAGRNGSRLQFSVRDSAGSLVSAAFNAALMRVVSPTSLGAEADSTSWAPEELARWDRPATPFEGDKPTSSDARWFWLACVSLIVLEQFMRTRRPDRAVAT